MNSIQGLGNEAYQNLQLLLDDGSIATFEFKYRPMTRRWTLDVQHAVLPNGKVYSLNVCAYANLLRPWRNIIPFGLACVTQTGVDPFNLDDFRSGRATLYLLTAADVSSVEQLAFGAPA